MKRIELCLEETEGQKLACSKCGQALVALHELSSFLTTNTGEQYFLLHPQQQSIHHAFYINPHSEYVEIRECFFLMRLAKVECRGCQLPVGLTVLAISQQHQWLVGAILLDPNTLQSRPNQLLGELITQLMAEIEQEEQVPLKPQQHDQVEHMSYTELVQESLSNITFYAEAIDQLRQRLDGILALRKLEKFKKSQRKGRGSEES